MKDVIIAPTRDWQRDPSQVQINDQIKDRTDAVDTDVSLGRIVPPGGAGQHREGVIRKDYHDMRQVHLAVPAIDTAASKFFFDKEKEAKHNGVGYPEMSEHNVNYLQSNWDQ